jgi:hypothetical protein
VLERLTLRSIFFKTARKVKLCESSGIAGGLPILITKRVKELIVSRDKWKNKALARKKEIDSLRKQVSIIKKKHSKHNRDIKRHKPAKSHFKTIIIMSFLLAKLNSSVSFRSLSAIFTIQQQVLNKTIKYPSYQTGLLWVKKLGYYQLYLQKEVSDDWIIIADESIGIGQEKLFVILGIRKSEVNFSRPLKLQDLKPLLVKSKESWKGDDIAKELKSLETKLGKILYAVTDAGNALRKGLRLSGITHIYDITHSIAIVLERIYKNNPDFKSYTSQMGQMRLKLCSSKYAHLIPPNQRSKSRFLNIDIVSNWGIKVLEALQKNNLNNEEKNLLLWVKDKQDFIVEMDIIIEAVRKISAELKKNGLSKKSRKICISFLTDFKKGRLKIFRNHMIKYFEDNTKIIKKYREKLLCTSDIIESTFGRYKNEINKNPMSGITDLALIIPAFTSDFSEESITKAIDFCSVKKRLFIYQTIFFNSLYGISLVILHILTLS